MIPQKLFQPIRIGRMEVKNRIVMPALGLGYTPEHIVTDRFKNFYAERAEGGVGLIIINVNRYEVQGRAVSVSIDSDSFIPSLHEFTDLLHSLGTKVAAAITSRRWAKTEGGPEEFVGPSDINPRGPGTPRPRPLNVDEIKEIVDRLGEQALRARKAGFDAVEFSAHVGTSLLSQFISPATNKRTDPYGGSLENRYRFLLDVISCSRRKAGEDYPLICRLSGADFMEGGFDLEDTKQAARLLEKAGVSALDITTGWHQAPVPFFQMGVLPGAYVYLAEAVKKVVKIPVIGGTKINNPLLAEQFLNEGRIDLVFLGRALIADPEFPKKAAQGSSDDIRPCVACCRCFEQAVQGYAVACTVNARAGREGEYPMLPASASKRVFVIGGGPAGLEAARVASLRGHRVVLHESQNRLGGQLLTASVPPNKLEINNLTEYLVRQVSKAGVEVKLGTQAGADSVVKANCDAVILATGASALIPEIPGVEGENVATAIEVLKGQREVGDSVIIIGGGSVGCETAEFLARKGKKVTILEMLGRMGNDIGPSSRWVTLGRLREAGVRMKTGANAQEINSRGVRAICNGSSEFFEGDSVVLAVGLRAESGLADALKGKIPSSLYMVGDCSRPRRITEAIAEAFRAAWTL